MAKLLVGETTVRPSFNTSPPIVLSVKSFMIRTADSCSPVKSGVSQGTIFGASLILLIYLNELPDANCLLRTKLSSTGKLRLTISVPSDPRLHGIGSFCPKVASPDGSSQRLGRVIRSMCICRSLSLRNRNKHRKIVSAHVDSKVN